VDRTATADAGFDVIESDESNNARTLGAAACPG
jgi:hypothetical protein